MIAPLVATRDSLVRMRLVFALVLIPLGAFAQPWRAPFTSETAIIPGNQAGDTAFLSDRFGLERDYVFGSDSVNNGLYAFFLDGGTAVSAPVGAIGGVDALPSLAGLPTHALGGLIAASATTAGGIVFFTTRPDGGTQALAPNFPVLGPRAVALGDFGDAGARLFYATGNSQLSHARMEEDGGSIAVFVEPPVTLPFAPQALAVHQQRRRVYASTGIGGVWEIDVLAQPATATHLIDAGTPLDIAGGLAVYAQGDGGALLIAALQAQDLFRVFRVAPPPVELLADFVVTGPDGGRVVRGAQFLDVTSAPFGNPDASAFPFGALSIADRANLAGANYKLVRWEDFASAATPPLPIDPPRARETVMPLAPPLMRAGLNVRLASPTPFDLAWWPSRDVLLTTIDGVSLRSPVDAGLVEQLVVDGGTAQGVDAIDPVERVTDALAVVTVTSADGGLAFVSPLPDGGHAIVLSVPAPRSGPVALADFSDAGLQLFTASQDTLTRWQLSPSDAGTLVALRGGDVRLPSAPSTLAVHAKARTLYFSAAAGLYRLDPLAASPTPTWLVDAGAPAITLYAQADGGALIVAAVPSIDRLLVFDLAPRLLAEYSLVTADGGRLLTAAVHLDVSVLPMGRRDGGAAWPDGVLAVATTAADAGVLSLFDWGAIARAATPPLPIDAPGRTTTTGGGSAGGAPMAGGAGGGNTNPTGGGRGGGGVIEEPPPGCCNGGPADALIPALAFVLWLRSFRRRTM